jgi:hypothetical protein
MSQANVVDKLVDQLEAAGVRLSVDDRRGSIVCSGGRITRDQSALIQKHVSEVRAVVKARQLEWQAVAARRIAVLLDSMRTMHQDHDDDCPTLDAAEWQPHFAVVEAAVVMHNDVVLDQALADLQAFARRSCTVARSMTG